MVDDLSDKLFNELRKKRISVLKFSIQTGIPKERVYKWRQGVGKPKAADAEVIRTFLGEDLQNNSESIANEPASRYEVRNIDYRAKYIRLLESNNETLESVLKTNLTAMTDSHVHLRALAVTQLNQLARLRANAEQKPLSKVQAEINKEVADAVLAGIETGIPEGIQGKGS